MAKAPAHKALTKATVKSVVTLHLGDEETDGGSGSGAAQSIPTPVARG